MKLMTVGVLCALFAAPALANSGAFVGTITCGGADAQPWWATARAGRLSVERGAPDRPGHERLDGTIAADGEVTLSGRVTGATEQPVTYTGRLIDRRLTLTGHRGRQNCQIAASAPSSSGLQPPYRVLPDLAERRATLGSSARTAFPCEAPPTPVVNLTIVSYYRADDPTHSVIDPDRLQQRRDAGAPFQALSSGLARIGDAIVASGGADRGASDCLLTWLDAWASAGGMLGSATQQGGYERKWTSITAALNAMLLTPDQRQSPAGQRVRAWLGDLGWKTVPSYLSPRLTTANNNHMNWALLAALTTGLVAEDHALVDWAVDRLRFALGKVAPDGSLPLELERAGLAAHYHAFAIEPTILALDLVRANGLDLTNEANGAIHRLARFVRDALNDPSAVAARVGHPQTFSGSPVAPRQRYAWAEIYLARHPDPVLAAAVARQRGAGLSATWLGGSTTLRYGRP
jgi:poly(beta-D-mannuronate) lyase